MSSTEQVIEIAKCQATAYVWGRQDAGESSRDTGYSLDFGQHYAELKRSYLEGKSGYLPSIETAFTKWRDSRTEARGAGLSHD